MNANYSNKNKSLLELLQVSLGKRDALSGVPTSEEWEALKDLAERQGLLGFLQEGVDCLPNEQRPPQKLILQWIGEVLQGYEYRFEQYEKAIAELAGFYNSNGFKMMVLKGYACSLDWPNLQHRPCGDIDIWLFGQQREADSALASWFKVQGIKSKIDLGHHHHTVFDWRGFAVENHYDFVNVHAHRSSAELERFFKELGSEPYLKLDHNENLGIKKGCKIGSVAVEGETVYLPSPNLHALFLIKHMVSHFAAAEITLRQVLDWAFFVEKHTEEIDWEWLNGMVDRFHMMDFVGSINAICVEDLGFEAGIFQGVQSSPELKDRILDDILDPAFKTSEPRRLWPRLIYKYKRWQGNAWKQNLCYDESRWESFWTGIWTKLLKPASI